MKWKRSHFFESEKKCLTWYWCVMSALIRAGYCKFVRHLFKSIESTTAVGVTGMAIYFLCLLISKKHKHSLIFVLIFLLLLSKTKLFWCRLYSFFQRFAFFLSIGPSWLLFLTFGFGGFVFRFLFHSFIFFGSSSQTKIWIVSQWTVFAFFLFAVIR